MSDAVQTARGIIGPLALFTPLSEPVMREAIEVVAEAIASARRSERADMLKRMRDHADQFDVIASHTENDESRGQYRYAAMSIRSFAAALECER